MKVLLGADDPVPIYTDPWALDKWPEMQRRLRYAGATSEEIDEFCEQWLHDSDWPEVDRLRVWALGSAKLRVEVLRARAENRQNLETEEEERARLANEQRALAASELHAEAIRMSGHDTHDIIEWVNDDPIRARACLAVEEAYPRPRADLLAALIRVVDAHRVLR